MDDRTARRALPIVVLTLAAAVATLVAVRNADPSLSARSLQLALMLDALGLGAEILSFNTLKEAARSIALIPFAATLFVAPSSIGIGFLIAAEALVQVASKRPVLKSTFNLAQFALGLGAGVLVYRACGGISFLALGQASFVDSLRQLIVPASALVVTVFLVNNATVGLIIAATTGRQFHSVFIQLARASAPFMFLLVLVAFYLSWLATNLGVIGTAGMVIPLVAVRQLFKTTTELTNVTEELLDLMVAAIEARDPYTSGHSKRVAEASEIIARAIGLSSQQIERVTVAALLHDVGKIDEAFARILAKEGRLTPEEWEIMKQHPVRSAQLVGMLSSLKDIIAPVRHHHENWDGTGYPDGLKGSDIPLASRIIMFADTLDAITTDRPYRKALGMDAARSEFLKFRGRQFDPQICDRVVSPDVWAILYSSFAQSATRNSDEASKSKAS
jgi:putative nucleotidyltransferase with HDIG domain